MALCELGTNRSDQIEHIYYIYYILYIIYIIYYIYYILYILYIIYYILYILYIICIYIIYNMYIYYIYYIYNMYITKLPLHERTPSNEIASVLTFWRLASSFQGWTTFQSFQFLRIMINNIFWFFTLQLYIITYVWNLKPSAVSFRTVERPILFLNNSY